MNYEMDKWMEDAWTDLYTFHAAVDNTKCNANKKYLKPPHGGEKMAFRQISVNLRSVNER